MARTLLECNEVHVEIAGRRLVDALSIDVRSGEFVAILGQNGCGKSLTLHTLAGLRSAPGDIHLTAARAGDSHQPQVDVSSAQRRDIAQHLALLPQHIDDIFPATVMDTVLIGRHPHIGRFQWESAQDYEVARAALDSLDLANMAGRDVLTLSGGERRRLAIAQVIAQNPDVYLLDEPTNHLDPQHQLDAMRLFRAKADAGCAVVASLHDVNLAARFADRCLLLSGAGAWTLGEAPVVLDVSSLRDLFNTPFEAVTWRDQALFVAS